MLPVLPVASTPSSSSNREEERNLQSKRLKRVRESSQNLIFRVLE